MFKIFWWDVKKHLKTVLILVGLGALAGLSKASVTPLIQRFFKHLEYPNTPEWVSNELVLIPVCIAFVWIFANLFRYLVNRGIYLISEKIALDLRQKLLSSYLKAPMSYFQNNTQNSGGLISHMLNDILVIQHGHSRVSDLLKEPVTLSFSLAYLLYLNWQFTLFLLATLPVSLIIISKFSKSLRGYSFTNQKSMEHLSTTLKETLDGSRIIKSYNLENHMKSRFEKQCQHFYSTKKKIITAEELSGPLSESLTAMIFSGILIYISDIIQSGGMSVGDFTTYIAGVFLCTDAAKKIQNAVVKLQQSLVGRTRIQSIFDQIEDSLPPEGHIEFPKNWNEIKFQDVSLQIGKKSILKNVSFTIKKGQKVALVGASGSGKTSLLNLLEKFMTPTSGEIFLDQTPIRAITNQSLRSSLALVSQDIFLFNESIKNNILFGRECSQAEIEKVSKLAQAHNFIKQKQDQYEENVGDFGQQLSGGEKQRISIARALLKDSPILLLDEPTSALDNFSEYEVQKALEELMKNKTSIIVAHKLSSIQKADLILVLEEGEIKERGTHQELIDHRGLYHKLYTSTLAQTRFTIPKRL